MKAICKTQPAAGYELKDVPIPDCGADEVRIKVQYASICGTDLHITEWDEWSASRIKPPMVYGHEFCGIVDTIGANVTHVKPGDTVSAEMHIPCNVCAHCMTGKRHICEHVQIAGIDRDGCFAEFVTLPKNQIISVPAGISPEVGACLDSLGNAVHAVSRAQVSGKSVLVTGCGPIGWFSVMVAKALGATWIYASDVSQYRLDLVKKTGMATVLKADEVDVAEEIMKATDGRGVDVVLEMSGNARAIQNAFKAMGAGGTMAMLGIPHSEIKLDFTNDIIFKEAKVIGIHGREMFQTWYLMLDLLSSGKLKVDDIITHRLSLSQFGEAMALVASGNCGKILLSPN